MATHSSVLAWRIPGMGEPGGLPSMGLHWVRHDWSDLAAAVAASDQQAFLVAQSVKNPPAMQETCLSSIPGSGRSPGEGNGNPLQYCCLRNPMVRGAWWATVHGVQRVKHDLTIKPAPRVISNIEGTERRRNWQRETLRCKTGTVTASSNLTVKL